MRVVGGSLVALIAVATAAGAQRSVSPFTKVRVVLADHRAVEGRVVSGDSSVLVVDTGGGRTRIARSEIISMSAASILSGSFAFRTGLTAGVAVAALAALAAQELCDGGQ